MIEYKFLDLGTFKNLDLAIQQLDNLTNNDGWVIACVVGKKNNVLILNRQVEYPEPVTPKVVKGKKGRFPNAVV